MNIFKYQHYRHYLKDFYIDKKKTNPRYSYSVFAQKARLQSPNYLKRVMDGTRNITNKSMQNFITGLSLNKKESTYFENLVLFNQEQRQEVKDIYFRELKSISLKNESTFKIESDYYEYLSHWYTVAIHEMVQLADFKEDPAWIQKRLKNKITKVQAKKALSLLLKIGFLKRNTQGKLIQVNKEVEYSKDIINLAVQKFHKQMIELALNSILNEEIQKREPSSLTICIKEEDINAIKKEIEEFRASLNSKYSCEKGEGKDVLQLNFQLFSLTERSNP